MLVRSIDIPQADSLDQVRRVVVAVCAGARRSHAVRRATGISARHVGYALHAARLLGWLRVQERALYATPSGEALLQVSPGTAAEQALFERAVRGCGTVGLLAPQLLDEPPDPLALARHIADLSGIAFETARRRVQTLLAWRHRLLDGTDAERGPRGPERIERNERPERNERLERNEPPSPLFEGIKAEGAHASESATLREGPTPYASRPESGPRPARPAFDSVKQREAPFLNDPGRAAFNEPVHAPPAAPFAPPRAAEAPLLLRQLSVSGFGPLRRLAADLSPLTLLVGGPGAGKSALFEALLLLGDVLRGDLPYALARRGVRLADLLHWGPPAAEAIGLGLEFSVGARALRYEVHLGALADGTPAVLREHLHEAGPSGRRALLSRGSPDGSAVLHGESDPRYRTTIDPGAARLALAFVPRPGDDGGAGFTAANALRALLTEGLRRVLLAPDALRRACSPLQKDPLASDGSTLALAAHRLRARDPARFAAWQAALCGLLPEFEGLRIGERPDDRHLYLALCPVRAPQQPIPAWRLSDSTLRALALTLLPCLAAPGELYLIEEVEAGLPQELLRGVLGSLAALPRGGAQLLLTAHPGSLAERLASQVQLPLLHLPREAPPRSRARADAELGDDLAAAQAPLRSR